MEITVTASEMRLIVVQHCMWAIVINSLNSSCVEGFLEETHKEGISHIAEWQKSTCELIDGVVQPINSAVSTLEHLGEQHLHTHTHYHR